MKCCKCGERMKLISKIRNYHVQSWEYKCKCGNIEVQRKVF